MVSNSIRVGSCVYLVRRIVGFVGMVVISESMLTEAVGACIIMAFVVGSWYIVACEIGYVYKL